jgi:hypothetical protein
VLEVEAQPRLHQHATNPDGILLVPFDQQDGDAAAGLRARSHGIGRHPATGTCHGLALPPLADQPSSGRELEFPRNHLTS